MNMDEKNEKQISERVLSFNRKRRLKKILLCVLVVLILCGAYVGLKGGNVSISGFFQDVSSAFEWVKSSVVSIFSSKVVDEVPQKTKTTKEEIVKKEETTIRPEIKVDTEQVNNNVVDEKTQKINRFNEIFEIIQEKTNKLSEMKDKDSVQKEFVEVKKLFDEACNIYDDVKSSRLNKKMQKLNLNIKAWRKRM